MGNKPYEQLSDQDLTELVAEARDYAEAFSEEKGEDLRDTMVSYIMDEIYGMTGVECTEETAHDIINHYS